MNVEKLQDWLNSRLSLLTHRQWGKCARVSGLDARPLNDQTIVVVSDIFRVTFTLEQEDGSTRTLRAVAKLEPTSEGFSQMAKEFGICDAESMVYSRVLSEMENLVRECGEHQQLQHELFWAECYLCQDNVFILEDLNESGYRIVPTQEMLGVEHALLALKALGRYHGMSLALSERGKLDPAKVPSNILSRGMDFMNNLYVTSLTKLAEVIETDWEPHWKEAPDKLRRAAENVGMKLRDLVTSSAGDCQVLCHGDFSMRNMLFHFGQDDRTPDRVKFVDFQGASWSHPCFDVVPFLCSSMLPQTREANLDLLLRAYWQSLSDTCASLRLRTQPPTWQALRRSYDSFGYFAMITTVFAMPALLAEKDEFDPSKLLDIVEGRADQPGNEAFKASLFNQPTVLKAMKFEIERCLKQNILT